MNTILILSILGLGGAGVLGGLIGGWSSEDTPDDDPQQDDQETSDDTSGMSDETSAPFEDQDAQDAYDFNELEPEDLAAPADYEVYHGTDEDDVLRLDADTDNPIMAIGGDGADTFVAEYPHRTDDDRPYDVIIPDFDPDEDVLTLEVVDENAGPNAEVPQDFTLEPAEDGSYLDVRVSVFDPDIGPESARDFVVRLEGISEIDPDSIYLAETDSDEDDTNDAEEEPTKKSAEPAVLPIVEKPANVIELEGDAGDLHLRGTRGDDTIVVNHDSGNVVVNGGAGDDTIDARDFERTDEARLRIDGSEGDDTYLFAQGINVSDDQYGGSDVYSMTVDPDQMATRDPSTVVWDFQDRFEINLPPEYADSVRIENQPPHYDPNLGSVVQRDDVFVGDTLVMRLINLDEEHRITLDSPQFSIVAQSIAA
ncbi:hypothetical protein BXY66_0166 [Shimia isoporae]|uniref:Uncharacterized protein n=1 Tax=Shimia isoporae TaxID=647720 RepID=A0A4R1NNK4_9RHOB|nr:hypothetical protein [Shimia isoporae]TCL08133.1 hypothetical protein BXY66_0166 [Shimia isoporae]